MIDRPTRRFARCSPGCVYILATVVGTAWLGWLIRSSNDRLDALVRRAVAESRTEAFAEGYVEGIARRTPD